MWFWITSLLLTTIAILGNTLVLYLIITRRRLRTKANWFLFSLAVADLSLAAVFIPPHFRCQIADCSHPEVILYLVSYFGGVSVTSMMAVTVERYCAIVLPLKYNSDYNSEDDDDDTDDDDDDLDVEVKAADGFDDDDDDENDEELGEYHR